MARRRKSVKLDYIQVPEDLRTTRAPALADLLTGRTGRRVSPGDALKVVLDLWAWVVTQVDESADDLAAEFSRTTLFSTDRAEALLALATGWERRKAGILLECLSDPTVRVVTPEDGGWRVLGVADRYLSLAASLRDARERVKINGIAKANGWRAGAKGEWVHGTTGEVITSRALLAVRLKEEGKA
jgi:hypothetical protein